MLKTSIYITSIIAILILISIPGTTFIRAEKNSFYSSTDRILVAAHRGIHSIYPENSLPAIEECIKKGIDIVEIDIRETKDGVPVLLHDNSLTRTTNKNFKIDELTYEEIKNIQLLFDGEPTDYTIPTLEEVLKKTKGKIILNLDFKIDDLAAMKRTYDLISSHRMEKQIIFTLRDLHVIPELYSYNKDIRIMPVAYSWREIKFVADYDYLEIIQLYHRPYRKNNLKRLEDKNLDIWVNALKKYDHKEITGKNGFEKLIMIKKVNVIQTDHPERLLSFLQKKGLHD